MKDVAIICDNHINVQGICCEIFTHTFVPAFSGTHGITYVVSNGGKRENYIVF